MIDSHAVLHQTSLDLIRSVFPVELGSGLWAYRVSNFDCGGQETAQLDLALSA